MFCDVGRHETLSALPETVRFVYVQCLQMYKSVLCDMRVLKTSVPLTLQCTAMYWYVYNR